MLKIGITGGIGSGKTTICKIFEAAGIPIYYSDDRAKWLMSNDSDVKDAVIKAFGNESYIDNQLNRKYIAGIVFNDKAQLEVLNSIVHPAVRKDAIEWTDKHQSSAYTLQEAALLFENGAYKSLDYMITVVAPEAMRIDRVVARDHSSADEVKSRINNQYTDEQRLELTDYIIHNDGTQSLIPQIIAIHKQLIELSKMPKVI